MLTNKSGRINIEVSVLSLGSRIGIIFVTLYFLNFCIKYTSLYDQTK